MWTLAVHPQILNKDIINQTGPSFDIRLARHFVVLVEEGSFSKAAERLFLSQSALSKQIQMLERTFANNIRFINRSCRPWQLTPAGRDFLIVCQDLLGSAAKASTLMTEHSRQKSSFKRRANGQRVNQQNP